MDGHNDYFFCIDNAHQNSGTRLAQRLSNMVADLWLSVYSVMIANPLRQFANTTLKNLLDTCDSLNFIMRWCDVECSWFAVDGDDWYVFASKWFWAEVNLIRQAWCRVSAVIHGTRASQRCAWATSTISLSRRSQLSGLCDILYAITSISSRIFKFICNSAGAWKLSREQRLHQYIHPAPITTSERRS